MSMGPLAEAISPPIDYRKIGTTAKSGNHWMHSSSWLHRSDSYRQNWFSLQKRGMTIVFPIFETVCHLSTIGGLMVCDPCVVFMYSAILYVNISFMLAYPSMTSSCQTRNYY